MTTSQPSGPRRFSAGGGAEECKRGRKNLICRLPKRVGRRRRGEGKSRGRGVYMKKMLGLDGRPRSPSGRKRGEPSAREEPQIPTNGLWRGRRSLAAGFGSPRHARKTSRLGKCLRGAGRMLLHLVHLLLQWEMKYSQSVASCSPTAPRNREQAACRTFYRRQPSAERSEVCVCVRVCVRVSGKNRKLAGMDWSHLRGQHLQLLRARIRVVAIDRYCYDVAQTSWGGEEALGGIRIDRLEPQFLLRQADGFPGVRNPFLQLWLLV